MVRRRCEEEVRRKMVRCGVVMMTYIEQFKRMCCLLLSYPETPRR